MSSKVKSTTLSEMKQRSQKIVAITAYDFSTAQLLDELVDVILVGDSLGMVIQGRDNTLAVTVDDIIYHTKAVARATRHAHLVADMPFMSYQASTSDALRNAGRLLAEGNAEAVKLEGGREIASTVEKLVRAGIPVMGHIGLTPQSVHAFGGYKIQGKTDPAKEAILSDAFALERAGAYAIVLEGIPSDLTEKLMSTIKIPLIGIGAGNRADGQILVSQDLLGMNPNFQPKFVRRYANLSEVIKGAVKQYADEVRSGDFPGPENSF